MARDKPRLGAKLRAAESFVTGQRIAHQYPWVMTPNEACIARERGEA